MNIMLVSVTERTMEIGLRMAVGARQRDIRRQFLTEATLLCVFGGAIGVGLSLVICTVCPLLAPDLPMQLSATAIWLACLSSTLVAVGFGYIPARNAARLNPIQALAHD